MCQSCRAMLSFHQKILNETLSLGDITSNKICTWSYHQCQISEKAALKVKVVVKVFSNCYVIKDLKVHFCVSQSTRQDSQNFLPIMFPKMWKVKDYELLHDNALLLYNPSCLNSCNFHDCL